MKNILLLIASAALVQCANTSSGTLRPGQVINERYYEVNGVRKVEQRVVVATTPRLETRLVTRVLGW
ncbi:MAG: hypothetical protein JNG86_18490 [Verrucomicrobiaceae bacterium]|nr:hypothetical protein [Verrucomicrobiaceae bacterium]